MKQLMILAAAVVLAVPAMADTFGTGANQFTIEFVTISGDAGDIGNWSAATNYTFSGVKSGDYRMSTYQITNSQWGAFEAETGLNFTGSYWTGDEIPVNRKNWYAAAQFVNWLNTSNDYQAAYNFDGGTFSVWDVSDAWGGANLYRHKDAYYFLPTEDEWVKAAYWNGTSLQTYATKTGESLHQGDGISGTGWNYYDNGYATNPHGPWVVGSGTEELNGTFDMMGNVWEWTESPWVQEDYLYDSNQSLRGGSYFSLYLSGGYFGVGTLASSSRLGFYPDGVASDVGFRVASVPEPTSLSLLGLGGLALCRKKR